MSSPNDDAPNKWAELTQAEIPSARGGAEVQGAPSGIDSRAGAPSVAAEARAPKDSDIKTRVQPLDEQRPSKPGSDCLVVIYSSDHRQFGKRYVLGDEPLTIGRGQENRLVLDNDSVSRRHCRVEKRAAARYLIDLDSTNGTYVNDELIPEYNLRRGDQVKIGDTIMKFLSGSDLEAQYHETIYRMTIIDGLTELHNKRYLLETLEREIPRARRHQRPLSVVMFDIDHFKNTNDTHGHLAGDYVLKELAALVKSQLRPDDVVGRYGGEEFVALFPETDVARAASIAEELRRSIEARPFVFEEETIAATISLGCSELRPDMDARMLLKAADDALYEAKRAGRNRVVGGTPGGPVRRTLSGSVVVHKLLAQDPIGRLVGFEMEDEVAVMAELGQATRDQWLRDLERIVDERLPEGDTIGRWQDRYLLAGLRSGSSAEPLIAEIQRRWESSDGPLPRRLRAAVMGPDELIRFQSGALEQLAMKLLGSRAAQVRPDLEPLPFPLAASAAWVESATSELHRLSALVHAIEVQLQFAVAVGLALIDLDRVDATLAARLREASRKPLTMGQWRELVAAISRAVDKENRHPGARWLSKLNGRTNLRRESVPLLEHVNRAIGVRNATVGHGAPMAEDAYSGDAAYLREILVAMTRAAQPLEQTTLVSVAGADVIDGEDDIEYELRLHTGPSEIFPVQRKRLPHRLGRTWMYLLSKGEVPLALSPVALCATCEACRRTEMFLADPLVLGPKDAVAHACGVTTNHKTQFAIQWTKHARSLHERIEQLLATPQ